MNVFENIMAFAILITGIIMTVKLRFFQITHLKKALTAVFLKRGGSGGITPFQALATALGGSIGTANIAGVAGAILTGGPGAVFWMWAAGSLGMALKASEIILAVKYRNDSVHPSQGGPIHYIVRGLGPHALPLARAYAVFGSLAAILGTALVQSNTIAESIAGLIGGSVLGSRQYVIRLLSGALTSAMTGAVIFGGVKRIGRFSAAAVPFMALIYSAAALWVISANLERLPSAIEAIIKGAFGAKPILGGAAGYGFMRALRVGAARGVYSNEAGVGSSAMAHAASSENDPVCQSLLGIFEVFADTFVMCSLTAFAILTACPLLPPAKTGMEAAFFCFGSVMGEVPASLTLSVCVLLFAFTSIIGWELYGEKCLSFIFGEKNCSVFKALFLVLIPIGAVTDAELCWRLGEVFNYLMAAPNLAALLLLSSHVKREILSYKMFEKSRRRGYNKG